ncbi:murein transglycosylase [Commensalibacter papalotli (ex Servin-Garciduenas et al. 2014)]|uniref:Murein transglycosylase n=2 Tax=Commensalibacter papalotli (ex Servin-Garciduenas et al. 2014) TaxID=1208583 RepID=W7DVV9_9PROT|nr:lytic transglycosylase domain-containing protein [Commensalibacter papalotli (ex Servin-Garciduenas et al. 2014)]EUK19180.1 murein transglycosylase [Commensalibacter papalotli (ex Servin-Garciduenas et al. 2014)]
MAQFKSKLLNSSFVWCQHNMISKLFTKSSTALILRLGSVSSLAALVAACSSTPRPQQVPIAQEVANYKARARSYYAPPGPASDPWGPYIKEASTRFDVPEAWIRAVMKQESGGNSFATSGPGAMGLMQLMPPTYDELKVAYNLGDDAYDPHDNIAAGAAYIRQMYDIYGSPGFLAAYNGGPGRLDDFLTRNRTLPLETRRYVASIGPRIQGFNPNRRSQADLLVENHGSGAGIDPNLYASAVQPSSHRNRALSPQASSVQQAWAGRMGGGGQSAADNLNVASLNRVDTATTESLNGQSLGSAGRNVNTAYAQQKRRKATTGYPTQWKSFDRQPSNTTVAQTETRQDIKSAWASRGYKASPAPVANEAPIIIASAQQPVQVASAPIGNSSRYYQPVSYRVPSNTKKAVKISNVSAAGGWGIQVGAFASSSQAQSAAGQAKNKASLHVGSQQVQAVTVGKNKLYRARVTGLSKDAAQNACQKLSSCMLLSPSKI